MNVELACPRMADDACLRREDAAAAGFRMIHRFEAKIRVAIGAASLVGTGAYVALRGTDAAAVVPTLGGAAGVMLLLMGRLSQ